MKKIIIAAALTACMLPAAAQETYLSTNLVDNDLNGTARYVGMGGAMEALGADLSTISTNPAGIGLFRSSQITLGGGFMAQSDNDTKFSFNGSTVEIDGNKTTPSFDQIGFVWAKRTGAQSYVNFAFNYHKSRNFNQLLNAANNLTNASQNKNTVRKGQYLQYQIDNKNISTEDADIMWNSVDANYQGLLNDLGVVDADGNIGYINANDFMFGQRKHGYIGEYDFNVSGNVSDRFYWGITVGIHDVHYRSNSYYGETLETGTDQAENREELKITGTGADVKLGVIFRPIQESPFRIGVYINTPVFYDLTMHGKATTSMGVINGSGRTATSNYVYDYKVYTPWKFGISLGHTVGNYLALGATYEYSDYSRISNRIDNGDYVDEWGNYYDDSSKDGYMNDHTKSTLKGVSTLKLGAEAKVMPQMSVRVGYNYISAAFKKDGYRDGLVYSPGTCYSSSTDYTNWEALQRLTCGIGYNFDKHFFADLAYQYSFQNGKFYPFMSYYENGDNSASVEDNIAPATKVKNNHSQLLLTVGYKF